jgi:hypothetical protein
MRGRNRRGPNPLTRSYESNGPDVKVRGTAQHVAEKYTQLARDAHVSGDPVMAESYLQHAEHYYRLIAAAHQAQLALQNGTADDGDDEDDFDTSNDRFTFRSVQQQTPQGSQTQPYVGERPAGEQGEGGESSDGDDQPQERALPERQNQDRNQNRNDRNDRHSNRGRDRNQDRGQDRNQDRNFRHGGDRNRERFDPNRPRRPQPDLEGTEQPVLPAFLTAPVRAIPIEVVASEPSAPVSVPAPAGEAEVGPVRVRRRRRPRADEAGGEGGDAAATAGADEQD